MGWKSKGDFAPVIQIRIRIRVRGRANVIRARRVCKTCKHPAYESLYLMIGQKRTPTIVFASCLVNCSVGTISLTNQQVAEEKSG